MKKIYFTLGLGVLFLGANAQQTFKIKNPLQKADAQQALFAKKGRHTTNNIARSANNGNNTVMQLGGGITCNTRYVAGATMNLNLTLNLTQDSAFDWCDSLAITFPAGITPNSSPNNPFPAAPGTTFDIANGQEPCALNPVSGQTISWGVNDDNTFGGIETTAINFTVNVTIAPTTTGTLTAHFFASTDSYDETVGDSHFPGDTSSTFLILPAAPFDITANAAYAGTACALSFGVVALDITNNGANAASNFPIKYKVNGGTPVVETYTGTLAPGATDTYYFNTPITSVANTTYSVVAYADIAADGNLTDDTAKTGFVGAPYNIPYSTSFENLPYKDLSGWSSADVDGSTRTWGLDTQLPNVGTNEMLVFESAAGSGDNWLFSPCLTFTANGIYRLKYNYQVPNLTSTTTGGALGVFMGDTAKASHMTMTIVPTTTVAASSAYTQGLITFTATTTGNFVIGFEATNSNPSDTLVMLLDDIQLTKIGTAAGIATLINTADLSLYPNPTSGLLNITTTAATATVEIFNIMGQNVLSKSIANGTSTIDINNLSNGVYSVQIMQNNTLTVGKIIKTN